MPTQHREFIAFRGSHLSEPLTLPKCSTSAHNQILEMLPDQYRLSHAYFSLSLDTIYLRSYFNGSQIALVFEIIISSSLSLILSVCEQLNMDNYYLLKFLLSLRSHSFSVVQNYGQ